VYGISNTGTKLILFYAPEVLLLKLLLTVFTKDLHDTFNCIHVTNLLLEISTPIDTHLHPPTLTRNYIHNLPLRTILFYIADVKKNLNSWFSQGTVVYYSRRNFFWLVKTIPSPQLIYRAAPRYLLHVLTSKKCNCIKLKPCTNTFVLTIFLFVVIHEGAMTLSGRKKCPDF
jgi:hypothetical protein